MALPRFIRSETTRLMAMGFIFAAAGLALAQPGAAAAIAVQGSIVR